MASLNTLRTKGGVIVSIVIGIALLAFLLGDLTSSRSGILGNNKMRVGEIAETKIDYTEYAQEIDYTTRISQIMSGTEALSTQQADQAREMAWESLILKHSYMPGFEAMGISAGEAEQVDMTSGIYISPVIEGTFANRSTGVYDPQMLREFIANRDADPSGNSTMLWDYLKEQMINQRLMSKYLTLVTRGINVSQLEVEQGVKDADNVYSARYISLGYNTIADSLVKVSDSAVKQYYEKHKASLHQGESRTIEYVVFDMLPSTEDYEQARTSVAEMAAEFETAEDPMQYAQANSQQNTDMRYVNPASLDPAMADVAAGRVKMYGPTLRGDVYTMARLAGTRMMPDTLGAKHILLQTGDTKLADSLVMVLRKGGDFAALALQYSLDQQVPGGDIGRFAPEQMVSEISEACVKASKGDVFTVKSQYGLHVMTLTYKTAPSLKAQIATVVYAVSPSGVTEQSIYSTASSFAAAAAGSPDKFKAAAAANGLTPRVALIRNTERNVNGLENSRELVRWAFTAKKSTVSTNMDINGDYVVAVLTEVRNQGIAPVADVAQQIRTTLIREEKARMLKEKMAAAGASLDAAASTLGVEVASTEGLQQSAYFIEGAGVEMKLIGAICNSTAGKLSKPIEGSSGVFLFDVTGITKVETPTNPAGEKVRLETSAQAYIAERVNEALMKESKIIDTRVKFF